MMKRRAIVTVAILVGLLLPFALLGLDYVMQERVTVTVINADVSGYGTVGYGWYQTPVLFRLGRVYHQYLVHQHGGHVTHYLITTSARIPAPTSPWREVRLWASSKHPGVWVSRGDQVVGALELRTGEFVGMGGYRMDPSLSLEQQSRVRGDTDTRPFPVWASPRESKLLTKFTKDDFWNWIHRGRPTANQSETP